LTRHWIAVASAFALLLGGSAVAATPREILITAAFVTREKEVARAQVAQALAEAESLLARNPADREAALQRAVAIGYRARLTRNGADAQTARILIERLAAANPADPETQVAIAGWHLDAIAHLGILARPGGGARKKVGLEALDRAVALGDGRALFLAFASLMRIRLDRRDVSRALQLAEQAQKADAPTPLDQIMQRNAALIAVPLRANDGKAAAARARKLLPFGQLSG
jgi:hypothetical protein